MTVHAILPNDRNNCRDFPDINQKYASNAGLCNQLYNIVNGIIECQQNNNTWCVIDSFLTCIYQKHICSISQILDLKRTTENLNRLPDFGNIKLLDRMTCGFELIKAEYGLKAINVIDVTEQLSLYVDSNGFRVPSDLIFNTLAGDPCHGVLKKLYLQIKLGDHILDIIENENNHNLNINLNYIKFGCFQYKRYGMSQAYRFNEALFMRIYECLVYNPVFDQIIDTAVIYYKISDSFMIHLRVEADMIAHLNYMHNNLSEPEIKKILFKTYTDVINHISPDQKLHILTYEPNNIDQIIDPKYLTTYIDNEYKTRVLKSAIGLEGRELCALFDLLLAAKYGKGFIGMYGSNDSSTVNWTFSYILAKVIKNNVMLISLSFLQKA